MSALLWLALFAAHTVCQTSLSAPYEDRFVWVFGWGLRQNSDVAEITRLLDTSAKSGLNGAVLSAGFDTLCKQSPEYFRRLDELKQVCERNKLELIPSLFSVGYGGGILSHDRQLAEGQTKKLAAVVIPSDFSQKVDAYERTSVEVIVDPTKKDFAGIVTGIMNNVVAEITLQGEIRYGIRSVMAETRAFDQTDPQVRRMIEGQSLGAIMTQLQAMRQQPAISVKSEDLAGAEEEKKAWNPFSWEMPAFTVMFTFFLVSTIAASIWMERAGGMFRRLLTAPLSRSTLIAGKMLAYVLVVFLQVAVMFGVGRLAFDMPLGSSPLGLLLMTLALALAATSLGMLVAALARSEKQADSLGVLLGFVLAGIGGCLMPFFSGDYGSLMKTVSQFTPHAHALVGYINLIEHNASLTQILPQIGAVLAFAAAFFGVSVWRLKLN